MSSLIVKTALIHCWWECKLVQPLWNTVWNFLKNIKIKLPYDPAVPFLAIYPKEALCSIFTIANAWKCLSVHQWIYLYVHARTLSFSVVSNSFRPHGLQPARLLHPWEFSRQEYWSGLPCPPPGVLPNPGIEPRSPTLQVDSLSSKPPGKWIKKIVYICRRHKTRRFHTGSGRFPGGGQDNPLQYCLESPQDEEPGRLQSMGSQRVRHD